MGDHPGAAENRAGGILDGGGGPLYHRPVTVAAFVVATIGVAVGIAGVIVAVMAHKRSGIAVDAAKRSATASERSAASAERSADTAETLAQVAREDFEMRRQQMAASLVLSAPQAQSNRLKFRLVNVGGSEARRIAPQSVLANGDVRFEVSGVAESIPPGGSSEFIGHAVSSLQSVLQRAVIEELSYIDALGFHSEPPEPLRWQRTT